MGLRTVGVRLTADVAGYKRNILDAGKATNSFTADMDKAAKSGHLDAIADKAGVAGLGLLGMAGYAVKSAADFEKAMSGVKASIKGSGGTEQNLNDLRKAALQAGKDTSYSATEAADAITELSKAGVSTADVLGGGLKGALSLAAAGQLGVGEAAETAASAMVQFKLAGKDIPHIADLLAAGAGKAQGSVSDMGQALNQSGLVAAQFGLSIEDTTGILAEFANAGLTGSDAGTSFKTMLLAMANPSEVTRNAMEALGISFYDAQGKFIGMSGVATVLQDRLKGVSQETRQSALAQIFGNDAVRAASVLYTDGAAGVDKWRGAVDEAGYASETARIQTDNLAGDIERLKGSLETLAIESGSGANGGMRKLTQGVEAMVDQFGRMPGAVTSSLVVIAGVGGVLLLALAGWVKLRKGVADAVEQLNATGPAGEKAAVGLQKSASMAGKAAVAFAALETAAVVFNSLGEKTADVDRLTSSLTNLAQTGKSAGELHDVFGDDFSKLGRIAMFADSAQNGYGKFVNSVADSVPILGDAGKAIGNFGSRMIAGTDFDTAQQQMASLDTALTNFMATTNNAKQASELWNKVAAESGIPIEHLIELLPNAYKKVGELNTAADKGTGAMNGMAGGAKNAAGGVDGLGKSSKEAAEDLETLNKALDDAFNRQMSVDRATLQLREGVVALTEELTHGERSLKLNSEEGRKNRSAVLDQLGAIEDLREARVKHGESLDSANKKYVSDIDGLKKSMRQAGFSKKAIDDLVGAYRKIPEDVNTKVGITGDKPVGAKLNRLGELQQALKEGKSIGTANAMSKKGFGYHDGGRTAMVGEHDEAGVVHGKEFVFSAATTRNVDRQAPGFLDEVHATGSLPGYASGGRVTWPFNVNASKTRVPSAAEVAKAVTPDFGNWPRSPGAQRGDSGVWRKILSLVKASGIPFDFGNSYRPGDPLWHGSGRAIDFMGYNQDRLAQFFMSRQSQVLELIHRTKNRDYGITRGHYNAMPTQWPLHKNHLHIAMKNGGTINEPITGVGASGRTYSFGENYQPERVVPNWQPAGGGSGGGGGTTNVSVTVNAPVGSHPREIGRQVVSAIGDYLSAGGELRVAGAKVF